jgi:hypothetical protein
VAENSKRERILLSVVAALESLTSIKMVKRVQPTTLDDIRKYAATQMPLISVIGGVPQPVEHKSSRRPGGVDVIISDLEVELFIYFMDMHEPDSTLSLLLDDIWTRLYTDQTFDGLSIGLSINPRVSIASFEPYVAFSILLTIRYIHTTGGI